MINSLNHWVLILLGSVIKQVLLHLLLVILLPMITSNTSNQLLIQIVGHLIKKLIDLLKVRLIGWLKPEIWIFRQPQKLLIVMLQ
ncbi:hypothetical protein DD605_06350 [Enterobacter cloacae complex sp. 3DZ3S2B]|nr:hypothetical protein DD603_13030 [Enterobacter cloacae complex sp. 2DZ2F2B]RYA45723.1 hypothetical protein DD605_06350 [Enterobacter cloacae complex sp. 3DZ3S2B]